MISSRDSTELDMSFYASLKKKLLNSATSRLAQCATLTTDSYIRTLLTSSISNTVYRYPQHTN